MKVKYLETLNDRQKEAVLHTKGPILIVAGAGAGKTKTITHRIIHLIHEGVDPRNIMAVTFTNKAAKEMRDRVTFMIDGSQYEDRESKESGLQINIPFISTFHSLGVYIIKENSHLLGLKKYFSIIDENDAISIIKSVMKQNDIDIKQYEPRKIKSIISKSKGNFITLENYTEGKNSLIGKITEIIWRGYENELKKQGSLDFDDLLLKSVLLLKKYPEIKNQYQDKWKYIHIDEYQDTNEVQYEMVKLLVGKEENICVVGDTDQNIYSWRGANIKNMLHFEKDFPGTKVVMLEQNYRSTKNIIEAANQIIQKNNYRVPKNLFTENDNGESITICESYDEQSEASFVAGKIQELLEDKMAKAEEIAILYRANFQSRVLEEALLGRQIPYQVLGTKFFERREIKDLLSYIKVAYNKESLIDIKRIINVPARGIGKVTIAKMFSGEMNTLPKKTIEKINLFYKLIDDIRAYIEKNKPSEVIKYIIEKSGIKEELSHGTGEDMERLENLMELVTLALRYDNYNIEGQTGLEKLLEDASLSSDQDSLIYENKNTGVRLMTVHASKGLEFKYVFVTGMEQDLFPHIKDGTKNKEDAEEERRLFYVAITRAKHKLFLTYAVMRTIFGTKQVNQPSEFIYDIPENLTTFEQSHSISGEKIVYI